MVSTASPLASPASDLRLQSVEQQARRLSEQDRPGEAVTLALSENLPDLAAELLARGAASMVRNTGDHETFLAMAQRLGPERIQRWPELDAAAIWVLVMNHRLHLASARLDELEARIPRLIEQRRSFIVENQRTPFDRNPPDTGMAGWVAMMRTLIQIFEGRNESALHQVAQWRARFPRAPEYDLATLRCAAAHAHLMAQRVFEAERESRAALAMFHKANSEYGIAWSAAGLACALILQGRVDQAQAQLDEAARRVDRGTRQRTHAHVPLRCAQVLAWFESGNWPALLNASANDREVGEEPPSPLLRFAQLRIRARVLLATGQAAAALSLLDQAHCEGSECERAWWSARVALERARAAEVANINDAQRLRTPDAPCELLDLIAVAQHPQPAFARALRARIAQAEESGDADTLALLLFLKARAEHRSGHLLQSRRSIHRLLTAALTRERVGTLAALAPGLQPQFADVLQNLLRDPAAASASLRALAALTGRATASGETAAVRAELSRREREIAAALVEALSNREIAARLHLSEQTVKWHLWNLFQKLGVSSRSSAARRLIQLGHGDLPQVANESASRAESGLAHIRS